MDYINEEMVTRKKRIYKGNRESARLSFKRTNARAKARTRKGKHSQTVQHRKISNSLKAASSLQNTVNNGMAQTCEGAANVRYDITFLEDVYKKNFFIK